jgi:hypothetical protein
VREILWRPVASHRNLAEATLTAESLAAAGLLVTVRGHARPGLLGEIPVPDAMVDVCVPGEDAVRARHVLAEVDARATEPDRACAGCSETSPAAFEWCWNCGRPFA